MKRSFSRIVILSCIAAILPFAAITAAGEVPRAQGWVNDYADILSEETRTKLNSFISLVEEKTGAEIAVLTTSSIAPDDEASYARKVFDAWKIGKKGRDNGALILLAVKERRWRIETGYGLEGILPDGKCGELGRTYMVPFFREGKYSDGIYNGVLAVGRVILEDAGMMNAMKDMPVSSASKSDSFTMLHVIFAVLFLFCLGMMAWAEHQNPALRYRHRYYGGGFGGGGGGFGGGFGGGGGGGGGAGGGF